MKFSFTVTFDVPDGTAIGVHPGTIERSDGDEAQYVPPFADELIPLPGNAHPIPSDPVPFRGAATGAVPPQLCPVHREPWKYVPAGTSKKDGKPYNAFYACPTRGCAQRPPAGFAA